MKVLHKQFWHAVILLILLVGLYFYINSDSSIHIGELFGIHTYTWFILACLIPITHQIYVLICWRTELYYGTISNRFGTNGFSLYKIGFIILILSRIAMIFLLAISDTNSIKINSTERIVFSISLLIPVIYLFYSVRKYFGFNRAMGLDHFEPDKARDMPFVKEGIFKYTPNAMYTFGFLMIYVPGILFASKSALVVALFSHIYIWVHYYFTELPDMKIIYVK